MRLTSRVVQGAYAGVSGGIAVAVFFLVADLVRLAPLSTPLALGTTFLGPGGSPIDLPVVSQLLVWSSAGVKLLAFTLMHLGAFAALGVLAVFLFDAMDWPLNVGTGALFGLIGCSIAFYASVAIASGGVVVELPSIWAVTVGNVAAGALIGGQAKLLRTAGKVG